MALQIQSQKSINNIMLKIDKTWDFLNDESQKEYFINLTNIIRADYDSKVIFPAADKIFRAFSASKFNNTKVIILGQDPYHTSGVADGLAFSTENNICPPSLRNIYLEIMNEYNIPKEQFPKNFGLGNWAEQGVLLLNSTLTVIEGLPASHSNIGWEVFTDKVILELSDRKDHLVFILWGNHAKSKKTLIDGQKHLILESVHPSPLSANRGFFGCNHFKQTNEYLKRHGIAEIKWLN